MGLLFSSNAETKNTSNVEDRTNNVQSTFGANYVSTPSLRVTGGGKKSTTNVNNSFVQTDHKAIETAKAIANLAFGAVGDGADRMASLAGRSLDIAEARSASEGLDLMKSVGQYAVYAALIWGAVKVMGK